MLNRRYLAALPVLAAHGLISEATLLPVTDLNAFVEARGWRCSTERQQRTGAPATWRATVLASVSGDMSRQVTSTGSFARGKSEGEALAIAVASMLNRFDVIATYPQKGIDSEALIARSDLSSDAPIVHSFDS